MKERSRRKWYQCLKAIELIIQWFSTYLPFIFISIKLTKKKAHIAIGKANLGDYKIGLGEIDEVSGPNKSLRKSIRNIFLSGVRESREENILKA